MSTWLPIYLTLSVVAFTVSVDWVARRRHPVGDSGAFWAGAVAVYGVMFWPLLWISGWIEVLSPGLWARGWHLHFDRTGWLGRSPGDVYPYALATPFVFWSLLLLIRLLCGPFPRSKGRWLAGSAGLESSRLWVIWPTLPLIGWGAHGASQLGGGASAYPAMLWGSLVVFVAMLLGVAFSGRRQAAEISMESTASASQHRQLADWPGELRRRGLELPLLARAQASELPGRQDANQLTRYLERFGERGIAPEMAQALNRLIDPLAKPSERGALLATPDDCGQTECLAALAALLHRRYLEVTLVVTARNARQLAAELERWLDGVSLAVPTAVEPLPRAAVWVVEAETLSDIVLPNLRSAPESLRSIGLVTWWALHEFSGVLGANLWALSRRLQRLLRSAMGRETRTLAFIRSSDFAGAQVADFVRRVLPHDFSRQETHVPLRVARNLHVYRLAGQTALFERGYGDDMRNIFRHPALVAARESARSAWPTYLEPPGEVPLAAITAAGALPVGEKRLIDTLIPDPGSAGASIRSVQDGDALALVERFGTSGRASAELEHHLALSPSMNPYVEHLLTQLDQHLRATSPKVRSHAARRLLCAQGDIRLLRHHLLLALNERSDTREGLQRDFRREDAAIQETLDRLADSDVLTRHEVRFLDDRGRLVIDHRYESREALDDTHRPLDTAGSGLIEVLDPAAGRERFRGVRLRLDSERATVLAYPGRIFASRGARYEVQRWDSLDEVKERGFIECRGVDGHAVTWRHRMAGIQDLDCPRPRISMDSSSSRGVALLEATGLTYEETVLGVLRLRVRQLDRGENDLETRRLEQPIFAEMRTRGLLVLLPTPAERSALVSLSAALRPLLTVCLGIDDDVLEVVPVPGLLARDEIVYGIAFVELFPGGIGLLEALSDADRVVPELLARSYGWLSTCSCRADTGCERCLRSPEALAASGDLRPRRDAALKLLSAMVGAGS